MISIRLSFELENKLNKISKEKAVSKSDIVKKALEKYFEEYALEKNPYELGKDLFGNYGSGDSHLSLNYKEVLKRKLHEKHSH